MIDFQLTITCLLEDPVGVVHLLPLDLLVKECLVLKLLLPVVLDRDDVVPDNLVDRHHGSCLLTSSVKAPVIIIIIIIAIVTIVIFR